MTVDNKYGYRVMSCVFDYQLQVELSFENYFENSSPNKFSYFTCHIKLSKLNST